MKTSRTLLRQNITALGALAFIVLLAQPVLSQTYLGGGYTEFLNREISRYDAQGAVITVQREIALGDSRWQLSPTLQAGLLRDYFSDQDYFLNRTITLSVGSQVGYQLIRFKKLTVTPYVGPYAAWFSSVQGTNVIGEEGIYLTESTNRWLGGVEVGASLSVAFTEQFGVKLTPLSAQIGNDGFRQGNGAAASRSHRTNVLH